MNFKNNNLRFHRESNLYPSILGYNVSSICAFAISIKLPWDPIRVIIKCRIDKITCILFASSRAYLQRWIGVCCPGGEEVYVAHALVTAELRAAVVFTVGPRVQGVAYTPRSGGCHCAVSTVTVQCTGCSDFTLCIGFASCLKQINHTILMSTLVRNFNKEQFYLNPEALQLTCPYLCSMYVKYLCHTIFKKVSIILTNDNKLCSTYYISEHYSATNRFAIHLTSNILLKLLTVRRWINLNVNWLKYNYYTYITNREINNNCLLLFRNIISNAENH